MNTASGKSLRTLKMVKTYLEAGSWINQDLEVSEERRLQRIEHFDKSGKLQKVEHHEFGIDGEATHHIDVTHSEEFYPSGKLRKKTVRFTSDTWEFEKEEIEEYDESEKMTSWKEILIYPEGDVDIVNDCQVILNSTGKIAEKSCESSWEDPALIKFEYDNNDFLTKKTVVLKDSDEVVGTEVYENDDFGNPVKRTTYTQQIGGGEEVQVATLENTYW